jgi:hypothetical protein
MQISGITPHSIAGFPSLGAPSTGADVAAGSGGASFGDMLAGLAQQVGTADNAVENLAIGGDMDLHEVTLAAEMGRFPDRVRQSHPPLAACLLRRRQYTRQWYRASH